MKNDMIIKKAKFVKKTLALNAKKKIRTVFMYGITISVVFYHFMFVMFFREINIVTMVMLLLLPWQLLSAHPALYIV